jgi:DNA-directed RNA polymerase specialized sigma24 family protein
MLALHPMQIDGNNTSRTAVEELLETLGVNRQQRELLILRYEQALSCNRIAENLKLTRPEIDSQLRQARKCLREKLNEMN